MPSLVVDHAAHLIAHLSTHARQLGTQERPMTSRAHHTHLRLVEDTAAEGTQEVAGRRAAVSAAREHADTSAAHPSCHETR